MIWWWSAVLGGLAVALFYSASDDARDDRLRFALGAIGFVFMLAAIFTTPPDLTLQSECVRYSSRVDSC